MSDPTYRVADAVSEMEFAANLDLLANTETGMLFLTPDAALRVAEAALDALLIPNARALSIAELRAYWGGCYEGTQEDPLA
jgi:hypothetical protein